MPGEPPPTTAPARTTPTRSLVSSTERALVGVEVDDDNTIRMTILPPNQTPVSIPTTTPAPSAPRTPKDPADELKGADAVIGNYPNAGPDETVLASFARSDNASLRWRGSYERIAPFTGAPMNPHGRTGVCGPGVLWRWGL